MSANATKVEAVAQTSSYLPLAEAHELATILDSVLETARALIPADAYAVWLLEGGREEWRMAAGMGLSADFGPQISGRPDAMPATPVFAVDVEKTPLLTDRTLTYRREGIRSLMAAPIFIQQRRHGTLVFYFRSPHSFTNNEVQVAESLARLSGSALASSEVYREQTRENARLFAALEQSERNFRVVSETAACATFIHDGTSVLYRNRAAAEIIGMSEWETYQMWDRVHPDDRDLVRSRAQARLRGEDTPGRYEFRILRPDGSVVWLDLSATAIEYQGKNCILATAFDVTERHVAVEQLQRREQQLRLIIDSMPGLVAYVDTEERFRRVNKTFEQWFQAPAGSFLQRTIRDVLGDANYLQLSPNIKQVLAGKEVQFEAHNEYADVARHVLVTYVPEFDDDGSVCGFVALVIDVTERKAAEDALRKTEKLAAAGRLAASIAHEINNPLESVTNLLYLLQTESELSKAGREYLSLAEQELTRVSQLATQTLRFHRQSTRAGWVRVEDILDALHALYRPRFERLGVVLERDYRNTASILAFEGELRQLLANLVANALDAMPAGGRLLLRTKPLLRGDGVQGIQVTVADTGQGIASELSDRIFEPFVTSKGMTGTGLGLWVSQEIAAKHGGSIRVRSRTGEAQHGTVFVVFLSETPTMTVSEP